MNDSSSTSALAGHTALITGGARRLGRAMAVALADRGAGVVVHYGRSRQGAEAVAEEIQARGASAWTVQADLADPAQAEGLFAQAVEAAGPIDFLVNSASIFPPSRLADFSADDLARNIQINAFAPLQLARALAAQGRDGAIVNILDARSLSDYTPDHAAYDASKRLLHTFTCMMAIEFAPRLRVNAIAPGLILPPPEADDSTLERLRAANPLHAVGAVEDILRALLYLLESPYVTGQVLYVDGGRHLRGAVFG